MRKHWLADALSLLKSSLDPVAHEIDGLDWKARLSDNKDRVTEHLIAFANHPNGGYLVYGIDDAGGKPMGVDAEQAEEIIGRLTNLGRDAVEPPLILDHAVVDYDNVPLLFVFMIADAVAANRIKRKDATSGHKFAEYVPYWV